MMMIKRKQNNMLIANHSWYSGCLYTKLLYYIYSHCEKCVKKFHVYLCVHSNSQSFLTDKQLLTAVACITVLTAMIVAVPCVIIFIYIVINQV